MFCGCFKLFKYSEHSLRRSQKKKKIWRRAMKGEILWEFLREITCNSQLYLQFLFWLRVYTKTIRQLGLVAYEDIVITRASSSLNICS